MNPPSLAMILFYLHLVSLCLRPSRFLTSFSCSQKQLHHEGVFLRTLFDIRGQYLKGILAAYAVLGGHWGDDVAGQRDAPEDGFFSAVFG